MPESRWSQRVTTEAGVFEHRRTLTQEQREAMRGFYVGERLGLFEEVLAVLKNRDIPGFEAVMVRKLEALQHLFQKTAKRDESVVKRFFHQYLLQVSDVEAQAEILTTLSYRNDEELVDLLTDRSGIQVGSEAYREARRAYIAQEAAEVLAMNFVHGYGATFQNEVFAACLPEMIRVHQTWIMSKRTEILTKSEGAREPFLTDVYGLIERGLLPLREEDVARCVKEVRIEVLDPFLGATKERWGQYEANTHTISFDPRIPDQYFYSVYAHELFHALSGKSERLSSYCLEGESQELTNPELALYQVPRVGLRLSALTPDAPLRSEYTWLNEAMTELCTELVSDRTFAYKEERALVRFLMELGLPWKTLARAYFTDDDLRAESTHPTPHVRELFMESERIFGKRFLADINLIIESQPTKKLRKSALTRLLQYGKEGASALAEAVSEEAWVVRRTRQGTIQPGI